jgi:cobalt transporter subunit CbtA
MTGRLIVIALVAGGLAGLFSFAAHLILTSPLIAQAELFEAKGAVDGHSHAWFSEGGFERALYTLLADVLTSIGFAALLTGAMSLSKVEINWQGGLIWGLCGFAAFFAAPSLGLPPELPGMAGGDLQDRQVWWLATVVLTAGGLAALFLVTNKLVKAFGVMAIILPHLFGAPAVDHHGGTVPATLAAEFVVTTMVTSGLFWLLLGGLTGWLYNRSEQNISTPEGHQHE